jgi:hypothetical protein
MATNVTSIKNGACLYGLRYGCENTTNDPNCNKCAERLANAVTMCSGHGTQTRQTLFAGCLLFYLRVRLPNYC